MSSFLRSVLYSHKGIPQSPDLNEKDFWEVLTWPRWTTFIISNHDSLYEKEIKYPSQNHLVGQYDELR